MSRILGIISEYNPFHNGHLYHLQESQNIINPDCTVCIMNGNFMQRGTTSLINKWAKAQMALNSGIDLVIELPTVYGISSAENFANGAIKILNSFKCDTSISFGSEIGDISILNDFANILLDEPSEYKSILNHELSKGLSFPKARENAMLMYLNDVRKYSNVLSGSNNILAIEYLKAIKKQKSNIYPFTIKRAGADYNSLESVGKFASATAIREMLFEKKDVKSFMPASSYSILKEELRAGRFVKDISCFEKEIIYKIRTMTLAEIAEIADVSEGLENKIKSAASSCNTFDELIEKIKSKRYTLSRVYRILLCILLGITKKDIANSYKTTPYIRVLAMNNYGKKLVSELSRNKNLNIITSVKPFLDKNNNKNLQAMLAKDILASDIYTLGYKKDSKANLDFTNKLIT